MFSWGGGGFKHITKKCKVLQIVYTLDKKDTSFFKSLQICRHVNTIAFLKFGATLL